MVVIADTPSRRIDHLIRKSLTKIEMKYLQYASCGVQNRII